MKINNLNSSIFSTEFLTQLKNEQQEKSKGIDDALRDGTLEIKQFDYEEAQRIRYEKSERWSNMRRELSKALEDAFRAGEDPFKAILEKYGQLKVNINSSDLGDIDKSDDQSMLDMEYDFVVERFAQRIYDKMFKFGIRTDLNNPMSQIYDGIERDKLWTMTKDINTMFKNAKDHVNQGGTIESLSDYILQANTHTISVRDLIKMNSFLENLKRENESFGQRIQNEKFYGDGIDQDEYKIMMDYITNKANKLGISDYAKGLYVDLFF